MSDKNIRIRRNKHGEQNPYFLMTRKTAQDTSLTWEARGVLAYLLSKPDDWRVMAKDLEQQCSKGRVYRILNELIEAGYIERVQERNDAGAIVAWHYDVYESSLLPQKPLLVNQEVENRDAYIVESLESTEVTDSSPPKNGDAPHQENPDTSSVPTDTAPEVKSDPAWMDDEYHNLVAEAFKISGFAFARKVAQVLAGGYGKRDAWKEAEPVPGVELDELRGFVAWFKRERPEDRFRKLTDPAKINNAIAEYRAHAAKQAAAAQQRNTPPTIPFVSPEERAGGAALLERRA